MRIRRRSGASAFTSFSANTTWSSSDRNQLLGQARHGACRPSARLQPIVVNAHQTAVRRQRVYFFQREHHLEQFGELLLARGRHQEIPERAEALALIAARDGVALRKDLLQ